VAPAAPATGTAGSGIAVDDGLEEAVTELFWRSVILSATLLATIGAQWRFTSSEVVPIRQSLGLFPMQIENWTGRPRPAFRADVLRVLGVDDYLTRFYGRTGSVVDLYVGYYNSQRQGDTIHSPLNCLPGAGWEPSSRSLLSIPVRADEFDSDSHAIEVNRVVVQKGLDRQLVLYWYQSHGRVIANEYVGRSLMVLDAIRLNRTDGSMVRVVAPLSDDGRADRAAQQSAVDFVQAMFPLLNSYLPL
jgi:EpsI family protein